MLIFLAVSFVVVGSRLCLQNDRPDTTPRLEAGVGQTLRSLHPLLESSVAELRQSQEKSACEETAVSAEASSAGDTSGDGCFPLWFIQN